MRESAETLIKTTLVYAYMPVSIFRIKVIISYCHFSKSVIAQ